MPSTLFLLAQTGALPPEGLYDIIEPQPERELWPYLVFFLFALLFLAALVWLVRYLLKARGQATATASPAERALRELDRIERQQPDLPPNRYAFAVSEALKNYFSERHGDPVRYETAEELLSRLAREDSRLPPAAQQGLCDFLTASEEWKFGNRSDTGGAVPRLSHRARQLIEFSESVSAAPRRSSR